MIVAVTAFQVAAKGVGRKDYSLAIESSVEPLVRSYQEPYTHYEEVTFAAESDTVVDIAVPSGYAILLYDFYASIPTQTLLYLQVDHVTSISTGSVVRKSAYGTVFDTRQKGFPFSGAIRFTVHNYHTEAIVGTIGCAGIQTTESFYTLAVGATLER